MSLCIYLWLGYVNMYLEVNYFPFIVSEHLIKEKKSSLLKQSPNGGDQNRD